LGEEAHDNADEILFIVEGKGEVIIDGRKEAASRHDTIFVTAGRLHNLRNTGHHDLKLVAVLSPPSAAGNTAVHRAGAKAAAEQLQYAWEQ
jgi:mannose-6-phosphate isomerase-like protein (cupin superfamily)